nr:MAG TPA: hypothetical protein [Caudoviricetes sp.]
MRQTNRLLEPLRRPADAKKMDKILNTSSRYISNIYKQDGRSPFNPLANARRYSRSAYMGLSAG